LFSGIKKDLLKSSSSSSNSHGGDQPFDSTNKGKSSNEKGLLPPVTSSTFNLEFSIFCFNIIMCFSRG